MRNKQLNSRLTVKSIGMIVIAFGLVTALGACECSDEDLANLNNQTAAYDAQAANSVKEADAINRCLSTKAPGSPY